MKAYYTKVGLGVLCGLAGKTRQAYQKAQKKKEQELLDSSIIVELVKRERRIAKRVGAKRLFLILKDELLGHGIKFGIQKFIDVLRDNKLLIKKRKRKPKLTDSKHELPVYPNKAKDLRINCSEQLWVSDITYIRVGYVFCYLMLITDAYSRKIVGYNFGRKMDAKFCVKALDEALENRCYPDRKLMHHTDRGSQYCSKIYTKKLKLAGAIISMTENGDPLENPLAERMNRTFKDVFGLDEHFTSFEKAQATVERAVTYYNARLPHSSIDYLTPNDAHHRVGRLKKHWKYYWKERQLQEVVAGLDTYTPD